MTNDDTAWIAERAKCDMDALIADVRALVTRNADAMNEECRAKGWTPFTYLPVCERPPTFRVEQHHDGQSRHCIFVYDAQRKVITITMVGPDRTYTMQTCWDRETLQCRVVVARPSNGEQDTIEFPHDQLGKAVSSILEPFFFPPPK